MAHLQYFFALTVLLVNGIMFGHFAFPEIPEKSEMPQKIFSQIVSDPKPETGSAFLGTCSWYQSQAYT